MNFAAIGLAILAFLTNAGRYILPHWQIVVAIVAGAVAVTDLPLGYRATALATVIVLSALWGGKQGFKL